MNDIVFVQITPMSELLFRDTTRLDKGSSNWIVSKKIPNLSVLYGAIISMQLRKGKYEEVHQLICNIKDGDLDKQKEIDRKLKEEIRIQGIYLKDENHIYIPAPLDLFYYVNDNRICIQQGVYIDNTLCPPNCVQDWESVEHKFISLRDYEKYKKNKFDGIRLFDEEHFFTYYHKVGIEIGENHRVKESHLYYTDMITFKKEDMGYIIGVESSETLELSKEGEIIELGGKRRMACISEIENTRLLHRIRSNIEEKEGEVKVKLILTAPFVLAQNEELFQENRGITILARVTRKYEYQGGYNMANNTQKPLQKIIVAGSVFCLQIQTEEKIQNLYDYIRDSFCLEDGDKDFNSFLLVEM